MQRPDVHGVRFRMESLKGPLIIELHVAEDMDDDCVALKDEEPARGRIVQFFGPYQWTLSALIGSDATPRRYGGQSREELGTALAAMAYLQEAEGARGLALEDIRGLLGWQKVGRASSGARQARAATILGSKHVATCSLVDASDGPPFRLRQDLVVDVDDAVLVLLGCRLWPRARRTPEGRGKHLARPLPDEEIDTLVTRQASLANALARTRIDPPGTDPFWTLARAQFFGVQVTDNKLLPHPALTLVREFEDSKCRGGAPPWMSSSTVEAVAGAIDEIVATISAWLSVVPSCATLSTAHERVRNCAACGRRACAECFGTRRCPVCDRWLCHPCIAVDSKALPRICAGCGLAACAKCLVYRDTRDSLLSQTTWRQRLRCSRCDSREETDIPVREEPGARDRAGILDAAARVDDLRRYRALGHRLTPWDALTGSFPMDAHEDCGEDEPIEGEARNIACVWLPQGETVWLLDRLMRDGLIELRDGEFAPRGDASTDRIDPT